MRNGREVKLDPEERILATPDHEAELDDANEHGAGAQSPPTSPAVALTDLKSPGSLQLRQFRAARETSGRIELGGRRHAYLNVPPNQFETDDE